MQTVDALFFNRFYLLVLWIEISKFCLADESNCEERISKYGRAHYCRFFFAKCQIACSQPTTTTIASINKVKSSVPLCKHDHPKCNDMLKKYGPHYHCFYFGSFCSGVCQKPCLSSNGTMLVLI